jgi:hypothetical protein
MATNQQDPTNPLLPSFAGRLGTSIEPARPIQPQEPVEQPDAPTGVPEIEPFRQAGLSLPTYKPYRTAKNVDEIDDNELYDKLMFFLRPEEKVKNLEQFRKEDGPDVEAYKSTRDELYSEYYDRYRERAESRGGDGSALSPAEFWETLLDTEIGADKSRQPRDLRAEVIGDADYEQRRKDAADDWVTTGGFKNLANAVTRAMPDFVSLVHKIGDALSSVDPMNLDKQIETLRDANLESLTPEQLREHAAYKAKSETDFVKAQRVGMDKALQWELSVRPSETYSTGLGNKADKAARFGIDLVYGVGSGVGSVIDVGIAGGLGTLAGGPTGAFIAASAVGTSMAYGHMMTDLYEKTGDMRLSSNIALPTAMVIGQLERYGAHSVLEPMVARMVPRAVADQILRESTERMTALGAARITTALSDDMARQAIGTANRIWSTGYHDLRKGLFKSSLGKGGIETITEFSQGMAETAGESIAANVLNNDRLDKEFLTWDNVKGWAGEALVGFIVGSSTAGAGALVTRPEGRTLTRSLILDAQANGKGGILPGMVKHVDELVQSGKIAKEDGDIFLREAAAIHNASEKAVGGVTDTRAQNQLIALHRLKEELNEKVTQVPDYKAEGERNRQLTFLHESLVKEIDARMNEVQKNGKASIINGKKDPLVKIAQTMNQEFRTTIGAEKYTHLHMAVNEGNVGILESLHGKIWAKDRTEYSPELVREIEKVEEQTGVEFPKTRESMAQLIQASQLQALGVTYDEAQDIRSNTDAFVQAWDMNRKSDAPADEVSFTDAEGKVHTVPAPKLNGLFGSYRGAPIPSEIPALNAYIDHMNESMVNDVIPVSVIEEAQKGVSDGVSLSDAIESVVSKQKEAVIVSDGMLEQATAFASEKNRKSPEAIAARVLFREAFAVSNPESTIGTDGMWALMAELGKGGKVTESNKQTPAEPTNEPKKEAVSESELNKPKPKEAPESPVKASVEDDATKVEKVEPTPTVVVPVVEAAKPVTEKKKPVRKTRKKSAPAEVIEEEDGKKGKGKKKQAPRKEVKESLLEKLEAELYPNGRPVNRQVGVPNKSSLRSSSRIIPVVDAQTASLKRMQAKKLALRFGIPAEEVSSLIDEFGLLVMAEATDAGVRFSKTAGLDAVPHEYSHYYLRQLQKSESLIWKAAKRLVQSNEKLMKATAKKYPDLSGDLLAEEALATLMGQSAAKNLSKWFSGEELSRSKVLWNSMWTSVRKMYRGDFSGAIADMMAYHMAVAGSSYTIKSDVLSQFTVKAYSRAEINTRLALLNAVDRAVLANTNFIKGEAFDKGRSKMFFLAPRTFILNTIMKEYDAGNRAYDFVHQILGTDAALLALDIHLSIEENIALLQEENALNDSSEFRELSMVNTIVDLWKENSPETFRDFELLIERSKEIPKFTPSWDMRKPGEYSNESIKRVVMGLIDLDSENLDMFDPDDVTRLVYDAAIRTTDMKGFAAEFRKHVDSGSKKNAAIARAFMDRINNLAQKYGEDLYSSKQTDAIMRVFRSMTINHVVATEIGADGMPVTRVMNADANVDERVERVIAQANKVLIDKDHAKGLFQTVVDQYNAFKGNVKSDADKYHAAVKLVGTYMQVVLGGNPANANQIVDELIKQRTIKSGGINNIFSYVSGVLQLTDKVNAVSSIEKGGLESFRKLTEKASGIIRIAEELNSNDTDLNSSYYDLDGKRQNAQSFSTHVDRKIGTLWSEAEKGKTHADKLLENWFYKNSKLLELWKNIGPFKPSLWKESKYVNADGVVGLGDMGELGILLVNLTEFANGTGGQYQHMYMENAHRDYRYMMPAPILKDADMTTAKLQYIEEMKMRIDRQVAMGKIPVDESGLAFINETYPYQFKISDGEFVYDAVATAAFEKNAVQALLPQVQQMQQKKSGGTDLMEKMLLRAVQNGVIKKLPENATAKDKELQMLSFLFSYHRNAMMNDFRISDLFIGDRLAIEAGAKFLKRTANQTTKGVPHENIGKVYFIMLPEAANKGTDAMSYMNVHFNNRIKENGGDIEQYGDNHKIGLYGVETTGKNAGLPLNIKTAAVGVNSQTGFSAYDTPGSTDYSNIQKVMEQAEAYLSDVKGVKNPNIMVVYPSSAKSFPGALKEYVVGQAFNDSNLIPVKPQSVVVNFNINNDYSQGAEKKRMTVQVLSILVDRAASMNLADRQDFINQFHTLLVDVMNQQAEDFFGQNNRYDNQALAKEIIDRVFANDMMFSSKTKLQYLNDLFEEDSYLHRHIDDPNMFHAGLGILTRMFNDHAMTANMKGGILQTITDHDTLKWKDATGKELSTPEVMVPPSMGAIGTDVILIRVPSTGPESMFVGRIVGHLPADVNAVKVPSEWLRISNADHDGDMLHAFTDQGNAQQRALWSFMRDAMLTPEFIALREKGIELTAWENAVKASRAISPKVQMNNMPDVLRITQMIQDGRKMVGIFANARKSIGNIVNMGVTPANDVRVRINGTYVTTEAYGGKNIDAIAELLQASLDNVSNLLLPRIGIRMANISEAVVLMSVQDANGQQMSRGDLIEVLHSDEFQYYSYAVENMTGPFSDVTYVSGVDRMGIVKDMEDSGNFNPEMIAVLKSVQKEAINLQDLMHIESLDGGLDYGVEKALRVDQSFQRISKMGGKYSELYGTPLMKHYMEMNQVFLKTIGDMTFRFNDRVIELSKRVFDNLGNKEAVYAELEFNSGGHGPNA